MDVSLIALKLLGVLSVSALRVITEAGDISCVPVPANVPNIFLLLVCTVVMRENVRDATHTETVEIQNEA